MKDSVIKDLDQIFNFLQSYLEIANLNLSDFLIDDHWDLLHGQIAQELLQLDDISIAQLPHGKLVEHFSHDFGMTLSPLQSFIQECCSNSLPYLCSLTTYDLLKQDLNVPFSRAQKPSINNFMSVKKHYEVELLSTLCDGLCSAKQINKIIDIGSGLGYLGGYLSLMYGYDVLALDSVKDRAETAEKRTKLLKKQWISLIHNALANTNAQRLTTTELDQYKTNFDKSSFTPVCLHITSGAQIDTLCSKHFGTGSAVMFTALHACGDLSSSIIRLFTKCSSASALSLIGCCYNLLNEQFTSEGYVAGDENSGFPMSSYLRKKSFALGINARSLASQSPERLSSTNKLPSESLYWRSLLQVILVDRLGRPKLKNQWRVGKIASKCNSFYEYVLMAFKKLGLDLQISEKEISLYLTKYAGFHRKCLLFYQFRVCLGQCIEAFIQLDRLLFLLEEESVKSAHLVQLFDPVQSPRCYAIIAVKS